MDFTKEQITLFEFVKSGSNHGIIDAVAGSGKTTSIIESASYLEKSKSALFCAFNRSIANEIRSRFSQKGMSRVKVKTLHALGLEVLQSNGFSKKVLQNNKYEELLDYLLKEVHFQVKLKSLLKIHDISVNPHSKEEQEDQKRFLFEFKRKLINISSKYRLTLCKSDISEFKEMILHFNIFNEFQSQSETFDKEVEIYYQCNEILIKQGNALAQSKRIIDFDDMLYLPFILKYGPITKYDFLFIDECQDLSKSQLAVALKHIKGSGRVLSVGDPYQSIYGFTGADIESFDRIAELPNTINLRLSKCFRCPIDVIDLAKKFREDIEGFKTDNGDVSTIERISIFEHVQINNLVISRTKAPLQKLLFELVNKDIPVSVHEDEIKEFVNDLRFLFNRKELIAEEHFSDLENFWDSVVKRNMYFLEKDASFISDDEVRKSYIQAETITINTKIDFIRKQLVNHVDCANIDELLKKLEKLISKPTDAVKLSTVHRAKGLENDVVFILEYDKMPLTRDGQKDWELAQEFNLQYVALTRSKNKLFLVNSDKDPAGEKGSLFDAMEEYF